MNKTIILLPLMLFSLACSAQSEWESPMMEKARKEAVKESQAEKKKSESVADTASIKNWKYIKKGAVPEVNGKVVFSKDIAVNGKSAQEIYDIAYEAIDKLAKGSQQISSGIVLVNKKEHVIVGRFVEWLVFTNSLMSLDRSKFSYTLVTRCEDNNVHIDIERISYNYEEDRSTGFRATAEELISDKNALNKKRTKMRIGITKFRKATIDRKDAIFEAISDAFLLYDKK